MASAALTMTNLNTASVMGSVTLSVLKRLTLPLAVVTSNSRHLVLTQRREWAAGCRRPRVHVRWRCGCGYLLPRALYCILNLETQPFRRHACRIQSTRS